MKTASGCSARGPVPGFRFFLVQVAAFDRNDLEYCMPSCCLSPARSVPCLERERKSSLKVLYSARSFGKIMRRAWRTCLACGVLVLCFSRGKYRHLQIALSPGLRRTPSPCKKISVRKTAVPLGFKGPCSKHCKRTHALSSTSYIWPCSRLSRVVRPCLSLAQCALLVSTPGCRCFRGGSCISAALVGKRQEHSV